ncbi:hypothetical protein ACOSQ3_033012 [Xanthoceras sorbifolium]
MAIIAILRRSASSLAPLASRLAGVNINYHSAVFGTALSHLNRKQTMKYVVPAFDFSSAIEIQNLTLDELLPQIIDLELKFANHDSVSEIPSDFPFKIKDSCGNKRYEENLKKAFLTKLEIRGIKSSTLEFLLDYKINKAKINKLMKLKKIKNSIEQLS